MVLQSKISSVAAGNIRSLSTSVKQGGLRSWRLNNISGYQAFSSVDPSQVSRHQHQLAVLNTDNAQLRETRRLLVLSLNELMKTFPNYATNLRIQFGQQKASRETQYHDRLGIPTREENATNISDPTAVTEARTSGPDAKDTDPRYSSSLRKALQLKEYPRVKGLFRTATAAETPLPRRLLHQVFAATVDTDPAFAHTVLRASRKSEWLTAAELRMYFKLCSLVGSIFPRYKSTIPANEFISNLIDDIFNMDRQSNQALLPQLIAALATQRNVRIGARARGLYQHMIDNEYTISPGWLRQLLGLSQYNRQEDLPFDDILERLAASEFRPHPLPVVQAVQNMFPYTDSKKVCRALKALLTLQSNCDIENLSGYSRPEEIQIDIDSLEAISIGAAQSHCPEQIQLVWEILEECQYRPTETIYENTIIAFFATGSKFQMAFQTMIAMRDDGFEVSRPLLRSLSLALRSNKFALRKAMRLLSTNDSLQTIDTMNTLMSCYAERGETGHCLEIMDLMLIQDISPDSNTYSFAIECLGKDIHRYGKTENPDLIQHNLDHADRILRRMEAEGVFPSRDLIRNYIELLCITGESDTADLVIDDMLATSPESVCSKSLYKLALENVQKGNFDRATLLASKISDDIPTIFKKIRRKEKALRRKHGWDTGH